MSSSSPRCLNTVQDSGETDVVLCASACACVCVGVSVQVPVTEQTWHHLQGSVASLTHLVPCDFFFFFFKEPTHAVATLPEKLFPSAFDRNVPTLAWKVDTALNHNTLVPMLYRFRDIKY